jgi:hypothetical protein
LIIVKAVNCQTDRCGSLTKALIVIIAAVVAVIVAGALVYWFVFRWEATPKRWCVMFYLTSNTPASSVPVSRPDAETGVPAAAAVTLDHKLDQVVNVLRTLPCATDAGISANPDWDDVYVVYRAIWDEPLREPEARVVRPELSAPTQTYFPGETVDDVGYAIDFTRDLTLFFEWAYEHCPAEHYAVLFWGHAMGPAGLFQPGERPVVVNPLVALLMRVIFFLTGSRWSGTFGIAAVSDALETIVQQRFRDESDKTPTRGTVAPSGGADAPDGGGANGGAAATVVFQVGQPIPKVDVAIFQDCWMGTLETAFELQDDVRYIVASQSLIPAGFAPGPQLGAVWPYEQLITNFLTNAEFVQPMMTVLENFFNGTALPPGVPPDYNRFPATKVLLSLMDCGPTAGEVSLGMRAEWQALVQALYVLGQPGRSALIEQPFATAGRLFELEGVNLRVGDQALIDILTFCAYLTQTNLWPAAAGGTPQERTAIVNAAGALEARVRALVRITFQSPAAVANDPIYTGVAALYKPFVILGDDPYIMAAFRSSYEGLRFSAETRVNPPPAGGVDECSWTQYAFDRHRWF